MSRSLAILSILLLAAPLSHAGARATKSTTVKSAAATSATAGDEPVKATTSLVTKKTDAKSDDDTAAPKAKPAAKTAKKIAATSAKTKVAKTKPKATPEEEAKSAEPAIEATPVVKSAEIEIKSAPAAKPAAQAKVEAPTEAQPEAKAETKPDAKAEAKAETKAPAETKAAAEPASDTASATAEPVKAKGGLGGWLRRNLTIRAGVRDATVRAKALRKDGQLDAAAKELASADAPQGLLERIAMRRADKKLNKEAISTLKAASKKGNVEDTQDAYKAVNTMQEAGKIGWLTNIRANRAKTGGLGLRLGLKFWRVNGAVQNLMKSAKRDGKKGELADAREKLDAAAEMSADKNENELSTGESLFLKNAMKVASRAARKGDVGATKEALKHGFTSPASLEAGNDQGSAILDLAYERSASNSLKAAQRAYKHGDREGAAEHLANVADVEASSTISLSRSDRDKKTGLLAVLGKEVEAAKQKHEAAAKKSEADNAVKAESDPKQLELPLTGGKAANDDEHKVVAVHAEPDSTKATLQPMVAENTGKPAKKKHIVRTHTATSSGVYEVDDEE